jgi:hypothetical protein
LDDIATDAEPNQVLLSDRDSGFGLEVDDGDDHGVLRLSRDGSSYAFSFYSSTTQTLPGISEILRVYDDEDFPRRFLRESNDWGFEESIVFPYAVSLDFGPNYDRAPNRCVTFGPQVEENDCAIEDMFFDPE